jgi:Tol biopolymer transport system component
MRIVTKGVIALLPLVGGYALHDNLRAHTLPSLDAAPEAELVGPGTISTSLDELAATFTPDGDTLYFALSSPGPATDQVGAIVSTSLRHGQWTRPAIASFSGRYSDYDPFLTADGRRLFFASNRPAGSAAKPRSDYDLWVVDRAPGGWGVPEHLGPAINSPAPQYYPSVSADGTLYFSTVRADSKGHFNLYRSRLVDGEYRSVENLGPAINGAFDNIDNVIAPDQSFIIFTSYGRPDALGNGDLYVSFNHDGSWTAPRNLGAPVNSVALDYTPNLSPDGRYLYWSSNRGFEDRPPARALTMTEFHDSIGGVRNGNGNIYRIPLQPILDAARSAAVPPPGV